MNQSEIAASLRSYAQKTMRVFPPDTPAEDITEHLTTKVEMFASERGWTSSREFSLGVLPYRDASGRMTTREGKVDIALDGPFDQPLLIEIDRTNKTWSLEKLIRASAWGHRCIWLRWGADGFVVTDDLPEGIALVNLVVPGANAWASDRPRTRPGTRRLPQAHELPGPVTIRHVNPATLMNEEQRRLRDARVEKKRNRDKRRKERKHQQRKAIGRTRGTPINPAGSSTNPSPRSGFQKTTFAPSLAEDKEGQKLVDEIDALVAQGMTKKMAFSTVAAENRQTACWTR